MKEILAGLAVAVVLTAVVRSSYSDGVGTAVRLADRRAVWSDLRNPDAAPDIRDARFVGPRGAPIQIASPEVLLEPAKKFAEAVTLFAEDIGETAGPEMGAPWLMAKAARLAAPGDLAREKQASRRKGAALRAPLPVPRPEPGTDPAAATGGVLSAALGLLEKAGLDALTLTPEEIAREQARKDALADMRTAAAAKAASPNGAGSVDAPGPALRVTHPDRAPGRPI